MDDFPKSCKIVIKYDKHLSEITGRREEETVVSEKLPFILFLNFLFQTYPKIEKNFPPGRLAFVVNGAPPSEFDTLSDGDVITMAVKST